MNIAGYEIKRKEAYKINEIYDNGIIMGINPNPNCPARYATWEYTELHEHEKLTAYWGHYFESEIEAYADYHARLARNYDVPWER